MRRLVAVILAASALVTSAAFDDPPPPCYHSYSTTGLTAFRSTISVTPPKALPNGGMTIGHVDHGGFIRLYCLPYTSPPMSPPYSGAFCVGHWLSYYNIPGDGTRWRIISSTVILDQGVGCPNQRDLSFADVYSMPASHPQREYHSRTAVSFGKCGGEEEPEDTEWVAIKDELELYEP